MEDDFDYSAAFEPLRPTEEKTGALDIPDDQTRADGTKKGQGFFGPVKRPDGTISTEISVGVDLNGKETEIPLMVPGLTKSELDYLIKNDVAGEHFMKNLPASIMDKAVEHAIMRLKNKLSPFAAHDEQIGMPDE
jgi:hypothetical protein